MIILYRNSLSSTPWLRSQAFHQGWVPPVSHNSSQVESLGMKLQWQCNHFQESDTTSHIMNSLEKQYIHLFNPLAPSHIPHFQKVSDDAWLCKVTVDHRAVSQTKEHTCHKLWTEHLIRGWVWDTHKLMKHIWVGDYLGMSFRKLTYTAGMERCMPDTLPY